MIRIETYRVFGICVALASGGATLQGCSDSGSGSGSPTGTTSTGTSSGTTSTGTGTTGAGGSGGGSKAVTYCTPAFPEPLPVTGALISDFDSDASPLLVQAIMPGGVWAVDVDGAGTAKADSMVLEACGTTGMGIHFKGMGHTVWGADVAAAIVSQTQPVDVSMYSGMSFVMKSITGTPSLIFKVQNPYSQPACGGCVDSPTPPLGLECYPGFISNVALTANSTTPIVVKWTDLAQQGWGYHPMGVVTFDPANLVSVAFAFDKSVDFDVCIDDVKFIP